MEAAPNPEEEPVEVKEEGVEAEAGPSQPATQGDALLAQQLAQELEKGSYAQVLQACMLIECCSAALCQC